MAERNSLTHYQIAARKRIRVSYLMILVAIPLLLAVSVLLYRGKSYMLLSLLILVAVMTPFFMIFENRKPKAREVVLIAVLTAITVTIHLIFHIMLPIQVGTALVIVFGIALGPEQGFLIGALSRFICNFYMGQGMWTPWQMFSWGILGFLAGLVFSKEWPGGAVNGISKADANENSKASTDGNNGYSILRLMAPFITVIFFEILSYVSFLIYPGSDESFLSWRVYAFGAVGLILGFIFIGRRLPVNSLTLVLFTFISTFIIYGGIMNFAAMVTSANISEGEALTSGALRALYISGLPYDLLHASSASLIVFLMGKPMIQKLDRIKIKYGIYK